MNAKSFLKSYFGLGDADILHHQRKDWVRVSALLTIAHISAPDLLNEKLAELFFGYKRHLTLKFLRCGKNNSKLVLHNSIRDLVMIDQLGKYFFGTKEANALCEFYIPAYWARQIVSLKCSRKCLEIRLEKALERAAMSGRAIIQIETDEEFDALGLLYRRFREKAASVFTSGEVKRKPFFEVIKARKGTVTQLVIYDSRRYKISKSALGNEKLASNGFKLYALAQDQGKLEGIYMRAA